MQNLAVWSLSQQSHPSTASAQCRGSASGGEEEEEAA